MRRGLFSPEGGCLLVIDVETSGLSPKKCSIVSIGAVDFRHPERTFYQECRPWNGALIEEGALRCNGFTKEQITDPNKRTLSMAMTDFIMWVMDSEEQTLAGHNFGFDTGFLKAAIEICNLSWRMQSRAVDLHTAAYVDHLKKGIPIPLRHSRTDLTLDKVLLYVGVPEEPKPHIALTGAKCTAEAFSRIIYGKPMFEEFRQYALPDHLVKR